MKPFYASKTPKELRDCWGTPQWLIDQLSTEFDFGADAAADEMNHKFPLWFRDGLAVAWDEEVAPGKWIWNNPPFSEVKPWTDQWVRTAEYGTGVVAICNSQTGAKWYHKAMDACTEMRLSLGRVGFIHPVTGKIVKGNNLGQTIFVFDPDDLGAQRLGRFRNRP